MRHSLLTACLLALLLALAAPCAIAQDYDSNLQQLGDRVTRLERDMTALERQVYQGGGNGGPALQPGSLAANNELQMQRMSDQLRQITGQIQDLEHQINEMKSGMAKRESDVDMRLEALEQKAGIAGAGPAPGTAGAASQGRPNQPNQAAAATPPAPPNRSGGNGAAASPQPAPGQVLPTGSPQQKYNYAFGLLREANYPAAANALSAFVKRYPASPLSSNALYWLGETYFVRHQYQTAASVFAKGYQKYPKGNKAADTLFRLGSALGRLGRKADACQAFARLDRDFPIAPANLKRRETREKQRAGCRG
ncbi:MAG: tol-pal system protein YbgF [Stellaceae bacterium]